MNTLLAFQYDQDADDPANGGTVDALAQLLDAVRAHHDELWLVEVRARPLRTSAKAKASGRWPAKTVGSLSIIDPTAEELGAGEKPTPVEIVDNIEDALSTLKNRLPGNWFKLTLRDENGGELASVIVSGEADATTPTVGDANAFMANEFAAIVGTMSNTVRQIHGLYIESAKENRNLVKVLTDSPLANAQVELLKLQLVGRQDQMEHEEELARVSELGGVLRQFGPAILAHFMGGAKPTPEGPAPESGGMAAEWSTIATELGPKVRDIDADAASLIEAASGAENDDACRACIESLREHMAKLSPEKQGELLEALGGDGMTLIGNFAQKWGME